ncbi:hypothetical protein [Ferrovibrio sp.]|uniref:hypothetical protein n=1 Tax=Ferrovibrio sp. TaxID=1917215 RepID=UPI00311E5315
MTIGDIVTALLPSLVMFFVVSLGANSLERAVQRFAHGRFEIDRLTGEAEAVRQRMGDIRGEYETLKEEKAGLELKLKERQGVYGQLMAREVQFSDPRNMVCYEIGLPKPRQSGWYVKAIGPEMHEMFSGPASSVSAFPGRRAARLVIWGIDNEEIARLRAKKVFGALSEIMVIRRFDGKLRLTDA